MYRLGIDTGGTNTDVVLTNVDTGRIRNDHQRTQFRVAQLRSREHFQAGEPSECWKPIWEGRLIPYLLCAGPPVPP